MRILHAMECTIGGTRRHLVDVARGQLARGHQVALAVAVLREPRFRKDLEELERAGARVFEIPMVRALAPLADTRHLRRMRRALREHAPEIVHTHASKAGALGRTASLLEGIGVRVHTPHTFAFLFAAEFGPAKRALFRRIERTLGRRTARTIAVSAGEADTFRRSGVVDPASVRVVRNGIDPAPWLRARPADRAALGIPAGAPLLLAAGLLHVAKGPDLAIEALARSGLASAHLVILGEGGMREALLAQVERAGLAGRVHLPGWSEDVPGWMAACDVVLLPSRWEAMPYVVLEGMASARPVVAAAVDGAREMLDDGVHGAVCAVGDADALAAGLRRVLGATADERARMGAAARERVLASGSAEKMVDELLAVYAEAR